MRKRLDKRSRQALKRAALIAWNEANMDTLREEQGRRVTRSGHTVQGSYQSRLDPQRAASKTHRNAHVVWNVKGAYKVRKVRQRFALDGF